MTKFTNTILFLTLLIWYGQSRDLYEDSPTYPEISNVILEKGKPIEAQEPYTQLQLKGLNGTLYSDSLSKLSPVTDLKIFSNQLREIETGAICSLPTLKSFEIDFFGNSDSPTLTKEMFRNCENLEELYLVGDYDNFAKMNSDVLHDLSSLKYLSIRNIKLEHLTENYFKGLESLTNLTLLRCSIKEIDSHAFEDQKNLKEVRMVHNNFSQLPPNLFKTTPKLVNLELQFNEIEDLTWDEFNGLTSLEVLHLGQNKITTLNADKISKNMPNLKTFFVNLYVKDCNRQEELMNEITSKLDKVLVVTQFLPLHADSKICEDLDD